MASSQRVKQLAAAMTSLLTILLLNSQLGSCHPYKGVSPSSTLAQTDSFSEVYMSQHQLHARQEDVELSREESELVSSHTGAAGSYEDTAGEDIYNIYRDLAPEVTDWLVEMDIVRNSEVERLLANADTSEDSNDRERKAAIHDRFSRYYWPNGRVPYAFGYIEDRDLVEVAYEAMQHWMDHTCLQFVPREQDDLDYILFVADDGCWSYVGKQGGAQRLSLGRSRSSHRNLCKNRGVIVHELGHAIGFWHEQSRPDRNDYVVIRWENMISGTEGNFQSYSHRHVNSRNVPYDYGSIMHYPANAFSRNGRPTIVPRQSGKRIGQRNSLSPLDMKQANLLYNCQVARNTTELVDVTAAVPEDTFPIHSKRFSDICLDITPWDEGRLYDVIAGDCNATSSTQYWKWTSSDQLLNVETFLCLASIEEELILTTCEEGNPDQEWVCAGSFIEQPSSGRCLTLHEQAIDHGVALDRVLMSQQNRENESVSYEFETELTVNITYCGEFQQSHKEQAWDTAWEDTNYDDINSTQTEDDSLCPSNSSAHKLSRCYTKDMANVSSTDGQSWATCDRLGYYTSGFYHTNVKGDEEQISGMECCASDYVFTGLYEIPGPAIDHEEDCKEMEWWGFEDGLINEGWFCCPRGMFLKGFSFTVNGRTHQISKAKCCKPHTSPTIYEHCYTDHSRRVANSGIHKCSLAGYHITSVVKDGCVAVGDDIECNEELTCCMQQ